MTVAIDKEKWAFQETLKGRKIPRDRFGQPMTEGELIVYAIARNSSAVLKVGKILKIHTTESTRWVPDTGPDGSPGRRQVRDYDFQLTIRGAEKGFDDKWRLNLRDAKISSLHNTIVLENPLPEILDIFKDVGNG